jgi:integrase
VPRQDHDLVFSTELGTPLNRHNLCQHSFKPLLEKTGLPCIRFHDLRHTCATLLLKGGVHRMIVQELLGHPTKAITLAIYTHATNGMQDAATAALEEAFS